MDHLPLPDMLNDRMEDVTPGAATFIAVMLIFSALLLIGIMLHLVYGYAILPWLRAHR